MSSSTVEQLTLNQLVAGSIPSSPISFQRFQYLTLTRSCLNRRNIPAEFWIYKQITMTQGEAAAAEQLAQDALSKAGIPGGAGSKG